MKNTVFLGLFILITALIPNTELLAQMGANIGPSDSEFEGGFRDANDAWLALMSVIVLFGGPFIIVRNIEYGDKAGFAYWKWWFVVLIFLFVGTAVGSYLGGLIATLGVCLYGIVKESKRP